MSRAARLGAFIVATLAILVLGIFIIGEQAVSFQLHVPIESAIRQCGGPGCWRRCAGGRSSQRNCAQHRVASQAGRKGHGHHGSRQVDARDHQARLRGLDRNRGIVGQPVSGDLVWICWQPNVRDGDTIASQPPLEMADLLKKTSGILDSSQQAIQNATRATANLDSISAKIDSGQGTVGALVNDKAALYQPRTDDSAMRDTMVQAQAGVTDFQENMEALKHNFFLRGYFKNRGYEDSAELAQE